MLVSAREKKHEQSKSRASRPKCHPRGMSCNAMCRSKLGKSSIAQRLFPDGNASRRLCQGALQHHLQYEAAADVSEQ